MVQAQQQRSGYSRAFNRAVSRLRRDRNRRGLVTRQPIVSKMLKVRNDSIPFQKSLICLGKSIKFGNFDGTASITPSTGKCKTNCI